MFLLWDDTNNTANPSGGATTYVFATIPLVNGVTYTVSTINENAGVAWSALTPSATSVAEAGGNDTIDGGTEADSIDGGTGNDSILGGSGVFGDTLIGNDGNDTLDGGDGNDSLLGGAGTDSVLGGDGNDTIDGGDNTDTVYGGAGNDLITDSGGATSDDTIFGDGGDDTISGGLREDLISGDAGNDQIFGEDGNDTLSGGADNDTIDGGAGADSISGGAGRDRLTGGIGADTLDGGDDQDTIFGDVGDVAFGGEGGADTDVLDLSAYGWSRTDVNYTNNDPLTESGTVDFYDINGGFIGSMTFSNIETVIPCFAAGTRVETASGPRPVEDLVPGDLVVTRDRGLQPLVWVGRRRLSLADQLAQPALVPVCIAAGALAPGVPARDVTVSPQHRILVEDGRAEMLFGERQVLVAATHLENAGSVTRARLAPVTYVHLLFAAHEIVHSDGLWSESFQPAAAMVDSLNPAQANELRAIFPQLFTHPRAFEAARPTLKAHEARVLMAM